MSEALEYVLNSAVWSASGFITGWIVSRMTKEEVMSEQQPRPDEDHTGGLGKRGESGRDGTGGTGGTGGVGGVGGQGTPGGTGGTGGIGGTGGSSATGGLGGSRMTRALGVIAVVVSLVIVVWVAKDSRDQRKIAEQQLEVAQQQRELAECQSDFNDAFAESLATRSEIADQDRDALVMMVRRIVQPPQTDALEALQDYLTTIATNETERLENPLPTLPDADC